ncbi:MAG: nucleotidyltransferase family protein [Lachnospiraceae bacterium]|nr:nucleotidyltransferase family protein [Lachnospiraceae bacterium]
MRTVGIIAEYNPFHTGHEYHLKKAKELTDADYAVVVMSPDFVQRGEPAIFDKYTRTEMALRSGADLVIELPVCYAAGSAEYFAEGAVRMLDALGVVDALCFGAEPDRDALSGQTTIFTTEKEQCSLLQMAASLLLEEPEEFRESLQEGLRSGLPFPQARHQALREYCIRRSLAAPAALDSILSSPNSILGIEYCKALQKINSSISPVLLTRRGSQYSDRSLKGEYCSASAIRHAIRTAPKPLNADALRKALSSYIPAGCADLFAAALTAPVFADDLLPVLVQKLIYTEVAHSSPPVRFDEILDISPDLSERIRNLRFSCIGKSFDETVTLLKTRQVAETHIRRALLHLILDIRKADILSYQENGSLFYAHLLGFRHEAAPLLHEIKKRSALPLLSKAAHASRLLSDAGLHMWNQDAAASHLYRSIKTAKHGIPFRTEYEISPIVF